jgi:hypothetical protein
MDQQGNEREVVEFVSTVKPMLYEKNSNGECSSIRLNPIEYELDDGTRLIKNSEKEFQTLDRSVPCRFFLK